jgi:hypothetical protein
MVDSLEEEDVERIFCLCAEELQQQLVVLKT